MGPASVSKTTIPTFSLNGSICLQLRSFISLLLPIEFWESDFFYFILSLSFSVQTDSDSVDITSSKIFWTSYVCHMGFSGGWVGKESACHCRRHKRHWFNPCVRKIPWSRKWQPTPVILLQKSHGQKSLAGYNPWSHKESDMTPRLNNTYMYSYISYIFFTKYLCIVKKALMVLENMYVGINRILVETWTLEVLVRSQKEMRNMILETERKVFSYMCYSFVESIICKQWTWIFSWDL